VGPRRAEPGRQGAPAVESRRSGGACRRRQEKVPGTVSYIKDPLNCRWRLFLPWYLVLACWSDCFGRPALPGSAPPLTATARSPPHRPGNPRPLSGGRPATASPAATPGRPTSPAPPATPAPTPTPPRSSPLDG